MVTAVVTPQGFIVLVFLAGKARHVLMISTSVLVVHAVTMALV
jgi:hypothetical protein